MIAVLLTFVLTTLAYVALTFLAWRRVVEHLRDDPEASQAFSRHVLIPLLGRKSKEAPSEESKEASSHEA
jgi:hypothetical protein